MKEKLGDLQNILVFNLTKAYHRVSFLKPSIVHFI